MKPILVFNPAEAVSTIWHLVEAINGDHIVKKLDPFLKHSSDPFFSVLLVKWFTQKSYMYVCIHTCRCMFRTLIFNNPSVLRDIYLLIEQQAALLLGLCVYSIALGTCFILSVCSVHVKATQNFSFLIVFEYGDNYLKRIFYLDKMIFSKSLVLSALVETLITRMGNQFQ